jgi:RNA polymerase sigma-70 factor (ECF subfamily)
MMLLHDARRAGRFHDGDLLLLADQDRSLWNTEQFAALYGTLARLTGSSVVELNRAAAIAKVDAPLCRSASSTASTS